MCMWMHFSSFFRKPTDPHQQLKRSVAYYETYESAWERWKKMAIVKQFTYFDRSYVAFLPFLFVADLTCSSRLANALHAAYHHNCHCSPFAFLAYYLRHFHWVALVKLSMLFIINTESNYNCFALKILSWIRCKLCGNSQLWFKKSSNSFEFRTHDWMLCKRFGVLCINLILSCSTRCRWLNPKMRLFTKSFQFSSTKNDWLLLNLRNGQKSFEIVQIESFCTFFNLLLVQYFDTDFPTITLKSN